MNLDLLNPALSKRFHPVGFYLHFSYLSCIRSFFIPMIRPYITFSRQVGNQLPELSNTISTDFFKKKPIQPSKETTATSLWNGNSPKDDIAADIETPLCKRDRLSSFVREV